MNYNQLPKIKDIAFIKDEIAFVLNDERIVYIPFSWSKKLLKAKPKQRRNFKNNGIHVFWDDVDEIIGIKNILFGRELFLWDRFKAGGALNVIRKQFGEWGLECLPDSCNEAGDTQPVCEVVYVTRSYRGEIFYFLFSESKSTLRPLFNPPIIPPVDDCPFI